MKTTLLPTLLLAGLLFGSLAPAQAQTTLLKIDYQNATVFHVLSDGRLLLPTGAVVGHVLTADSDGYATWQAASGTGGLSVVTSDATLTGEGTAGNPLGVSVPLELIGSASTGVIRGENVSGNRGYLGGLGGVAGAHSNGNFGFLGHSDGGVYGGHSNGNFGYLGSTSGVYGEHNNGNRGHIGDHASGAFGRHREGSYGVLGVQGAGVQGYYGASNGNRSSLGTASAGLSATGSPWAGYFQGDVHVTGTLTGGTAASKVDHPLDPANRYLSQSFVESPEMKNVYDGTVTTDARGEAVVELPGYVEALNRDFRYQLTTIGGFAPVYIAEEISGNQFRIAGGKPGMKVSWLVTGVRQDAWAEEHRIVVEEDKPSEERGYYLHPKLFGQPEERGIMWERDPEMMREIQEQPVRLEAERRQIEQEHPR